MSDPVEAIIRAWNDPGPVPEHHAKMQSYFLSAWPSLARPVKELADSQSTRVVEPDTYEIHNGLGIVPKACLECSGQGTIRVGWFRKRVCHWCNGSGRRP